MRLPTPLQNWLSYYRRWTGPRRVAEPEREPLRAELFNLEQLRLHAAQLGQSHRPGQRRGPELLLPRLAENEAELLRTYQLICAAVSRGRRVAPAAEWLLDNFHLIEQQIRMARLHLPRSYSRRLPRLTSGPRAGWPRVYDIALELIAHVDGRLDAENLSVFLAAYQSIAPVNLGELWAVPIMLRLALIENLRRVAVRIAKRREDRDLALAWAQRVLERAEADPAGLIQILAELAQSEPPLTNAFIEEFSRPLQGQGPRVAFVLSWIEHRLVEEGLSVEQLQRADSQAQAADQVSIGNTIGSLRFLGAMNWPEFIETMSVTEQELRQDPADVYADMEFQARDRYRHRVEAIAHRARCGEPAVAQLAIALAARALHTDGPKARSAHVGYWLIDAGCMELQRVLGLQTPLRGLWQLCRRPLALPLYLGAIALVTFLVSGWLVGQHPGWDWTSWPYWLLSLCLLVVASQFGVGLTNFLVTLLLRPRVLPQLDFRHGVPTDHRAIVVIPTLLSSAAAVEQLLERLELHYLANRDENLFFALLTDFTDTPEATLPADAALLDQVQAGITDLNERYRESELTRFYLFHRARVWNPHERLWMGWERKRGKLEQFNALLRGAGTNAFSTIIGRQSVLRTIKYVITLDTDTQLPRNSARKLVGLMAHPLNRPRYDAAKRRVVEGYTILQPRVSISLTCASRSRFVQLGAGDTGLDPYTHEVSDVYQDLFGEGTFIGKAIYDVDAFRASLEQQFPENLILSHDLLESGYVRSALVSNVELLEEHPATYPGEASRRHRWIRGDWQILAWLLPYVPGPEGRWRRNPLPALARWKIFDNIRRSLVAPAWLLLLLCAWTMPLGPVGLWSAVAATLTLLPALWSALPDLVRKQRDTPWQLHATAVAHNTSAHLAQTAWSLLFLPYDALICLDAIARSGLKMLFSRRGLFLWHTRYYAVRNARHSVPGYFAEMWVAPLTGLGAALVLALFNQRELWVSLPLLLAWTMAPLLGWWLSQPLPIPRPTIKPGQRELLRLTARKTWRFFEEFVTARENWLPPDNFQEEPGPVVAGRTSPTNIGLALLSNLAAYDFGYVGMTTLLARTERTLQTLQQLERFRGHFYNWYDTRTLRVLPPSYVSSVDSGNLLGALRTLRAGLLELETQPVFGAQFWSGLADTLGAVIEAAPPRSALRTGAEQLRGQVAELAPSTLATIRGAVHQCREQVRQLELLLPEAASIEQRYWTASLVRQLEAAWAELDPFLPVGLGAVPSLAELAQRDSNHARGAQAQASERLGRIRVLAALCDELAQMDFQFLYDPTRKLFAIGYNVGERRRDPAHYDLLASEARLASFLLIAEGQFPEEHWFAMSRLMTRHDHALVLLSWSGSMFEYLMPLLVMPQFHGTLLAETCRGVVERQIEYGQQRGIPWGMSESGYYATDLHHNYQYRAFGVPGLGLKRGLTEDIVIAPYATMLAAMVNPAAASDNLRALAALGAAGGYGFYEALDFTAGRVPRGQKLALVKSYMAHHQGMGLLGLAYALLERPMQRRFLADPLVRATELLLQEKLPRGVAVLQPHAPEVSAATRPAAELPAAMRVFNRPDTITPEVQLLSNGRYHVMATNAGGGYSRWHDLAVTRWREDVTRDWPGICCYLRDRDRGAFWSTAFLPVQQIGDRYEAIFLQARVEYRHRYLELDAHTEICVSSEDDVEIRRVTLTNLAGKLRHLDVTSYGEIVLASLASDLAHRAFSNLFVQTEILPDTATILATRRARTPHETPPWLFHILTIQGGGVLGRPSFETDRARFVGRNRTLAYPAALTEVADLGNSAGSVLDPVIAIRQALTIAPDAVATVHIATGMADTREKALALAEKYRDARLANRAFEMAWTHNQVVLRHLDTSEADAQQYDRLAAAVLLAAPVHRAAPSMLQRNRRGQHALWAFGISGDLPIVLVRISDINRVGLVKQILQAHAYWRLKGLAADLVILNEDFSGYRQNLQDAIIGLINAAQAGSWVDKPGGVYVRRGEQLNEEDRVLFQAAARLVLTDTAETLAEQVDRRLPAERRIPRFAPTRPSLEEEPVPAPVVRDLILGSGLGGFTPDGREYILSLANGTTTPAPWANVIANPAIGTVITETGGAYTWVENAHEFRLTPWHNDPVTDLSGEAFYIRDEETGRFWSPSPLPARSPGTYTVRHGFGYSVHELVHDGLGSALWSYVAVDAPVKLMVLKLHNHSTRPRQVSVTGFWELVLGEMRHRHAPHIVTETDPHTGAVLARNRWQSAFADRVVFAAVNDPTRTVTGSRLEFLGRNGTPTRPAALERAHLSGRVGAGLDPCAALQARATLLPGAEHEFVFLLGAGRDLQEAQSLIHRFGGAAGAHSALEAVWEQWNRILGTVYVESPDPGFNVLANGWLVYQTIACRYWGRSGYYQSGGAFGFRDQLQDTAALLLAAPWLTREQLLRAAAHQFGEGDVQHWWHPPDDRGVRTQVSDDYLWLPYVACQYVAAIGDTGVLDLPVPFLEGRPVGADEEAYYDQPQRSAERASLYEHCVRALKRGLRFGAHGLPLIGSGDWNDGMNLVGPHGQGESVWLGFFLYDVLGQFERLAAARHDAEVRTLCRTEAERLRANLESHGWDGAWYRRAYFDDGTPLGSQTNEECQIDSIAQSWAVLSGAATPARAAAAMSALYERLVRPDLGLIQLFDPPFDKSALQPGYIKGYVPGVRENGGQYTHGALWAIMAFAAQGNAERAWKLWRLISPITHTDRPQTVARYKVEPYVMAADVYATPQHAGRGGWTWYTGSAGWAYRLLIETFLGLHLAVDKLRVQPCFPPGWDSCKVVYRFRETFYTLQIRRESPAAHEVTTVVLDGTPQPDLVIPLVDDNQKHEAIITLR